MAKKATTTGSASAEAPKCPVTRDQFKLKAKPMALKLDESLQVADAREFSTGSFGWGFSGKVTMMVDGIPVKCQVSCNVTVVGSKELQ